jgi:S1-C subfamily serine protease
MGLTVHFDGPDVASDWDLLIGDLFLFTSLPDLVGSYVGDGFQLAELPSSSMMRAAGFKGNDILTSVNGVSVASLNQENVPESVLTGQAQVKILRNGVEMTLFLVRVTQIALPTPTQE